MNEIITIDRLECPEPGVYEDVPFDEYLRWDAISASGLKNIKRSPRYFKWEKEHPGGSTPAKDFGTACHCALMEPVRWKRSYEALPPGSGVTAVVKAAKARIINCGKIPMKPADYQAVLDIVESMKDHEIAWATIRAPDNKIEVSMIWDMATPSGVVVRCKMRPDITDPITKVLVDLKSSKAAHEHSFPYEVENWGYHISAAFYLDGCEALKMPMDEYLFIAWEKTPPYEPILFRSIDRMLEAGREDYRKLIDVYGNCLTKDVWPAYPTGIVPLDLPGKYYYRKERGI